MFKTVGIIGLGLIGGSIAKALKTNNCAKQVIAYDSNSEVVEVALADSLIDLAATSIEQIASSSDIVVLAVPCKAYAAIFSIIAQHMQTHAVITDVASIKQDIIAACQRNSEQLMVNYVPAHPIAGSHNSGIHAANASLFTQHKVIITPTSVTSERACVQVTQFWQLLGAQVVTMDPAEHDRILALTSHLPHLIAFALVDSLSRDKSSRDIFRYASGGFKDFTRIAASDSHMWHDIFLSNKKFVTQAIAQFKQSLEQLEQQIDSADAQHQELLATLTKAKATRSHFAHMYNHTSSSAGHTQSFKQFSVQTGGSLQGEVAIPGDKSISHRAVMFASLANGVSKINNFLAGADSLATVNAFRQMGVVIEGPTEGKLTIYGNGLHGLKAPDAPLDLGNSGTSMRLLCGILAGAKFESVLTGDESLSQRPMARVIQPLEQMGAQIAATDDNLPPLQIGGKQQLNAIDYTLPMASAQVKSAILLAGLYAGGNTSVIEPIVTRDHTELMLQAFGVKVSRQDTRITVYPSELQPRDIMVPSDISSATFFIVGASIAPGSNILLPGVGINPTRSAIISILQAMGANIQILNERYYGKEPVADIQVSYAQLTGIAVDEALIAIAIDEFPALCIAAACASGTTTIVGASELRVKESDRIAAMAQGLTQLGIEITEQAGGMQIEGGIIGGGKIDSFGDHRIAMSFAMAALVAQQAITITDCANVATSFPSFVTLAQSAGLKISAS
jgi:cyclohexadieny/prephenate dehydrogenase / 3-phosphoshikimate 1-carboxyvinyltransferase